MTWAPAVDGGLGTAGGSGGGTGADTRTGARGAARHRQAEGRGGAAAPLCPEGPEEGAPDVLSQTQTDDRPA